MLLVNVVHFDLKKTISTTDERTLCHYKNTICFKKKSE